QFVPELLRATGSCSRMGALLLAEPDVVDTPNAARAHFERDIALDAVTFGYNPSRPAVQELTLQIPKGEFVGIVGPSGSGKSTVLVLLLRLYDPEGGRVLIDGVGLRSLTQDSWRSSVAPVLQDSLLFEDTIRENIRVARPDASDSDVEAAARAAQLHEWVETLPARYDTPVGRGGRRLSGRQRQRLARAPALL